MTNAFIGQGVHGGHIEMKNRDRKTSIILAAAATLAAILLAGSAWSAVSGDCVNCHTMHNSQDGTAIEFNGEINEDANASLLKSDCIGCHSNPAGSETILTLGDSRIPIVYNPGGGLAYPSDGSTSGTLAGGNFYWVATQGDAYGHNVRGISETDQNLPFAPGGFDGGDGCNNCHGSMAYTNGGCVSCHLPAHHRDAAGDIVGQDHGWYRFLGSTMYADLTAPGVMGVESGDWEQTVSSTNHNVYKGTERLYGTSFSMQDNSIGSFCAGCHGNFHHPGYAAPGGGMTNSLGAWIRHPSDVIIPNEREYADYTTYDPLAPVAKTSLDGSVTDAVVPGEDVVTCISCHRAHGSPYPDMLRWDYANDCNTGNADTETEPCGCYSCHTTKDGA
jgi:predicted CXXCH cytochrome family protein